MLRSSALSHKTDIILVKPGSQKQIYGDLSDFALTGIEQPLWAALLAARLRQLGYSVILLDAEVENLSYADTARAMADADARLSCVVVSGTNPSASTMNMLGAEQILKEFATIVPGADTLIMGLHPSALPERTLRESGARFVCVGEGFTTLPALLDALKAGAEDFAIPGLLYNGADGRVRANPPAPTFENLDELPAPAWDMLPMERYRAHNWHCFGHINERQPYAVIYTSLGCPYKCSFCCINTLYGRRGIRYRSLEGVVAEIDMLVERWGVKNIKILDEMFALDEKRVEHLCEMLIERGHDLNIWAYARVNTVTEPMLAKMRAAGIRWLAYGFESASERVLKAVSKGYSMDQVATVVDWTRKHGIHICANYIFGLPEDDYDSMNQTLAFMIDMNAEWANIYSTMAYPGSKLYDDAVKQGLPLPETWLGFSQYSPECLPLPTKYLTGGQVVAFRDYAFEAYFRNPRYLSMIARTFGRETADHILEMSAHRLRRTYASF